MYTSDGVLSLSLSLSRTENQNQNQSQIFIIKITLRPEIHEALIQAQYYIPRIVNVPYIQPKITLFHIGPIRLTPSVPCRSSFSNSRTPPDILAPLPVFNLLA